MERLLQIQMHSLGGDPVAEMAACRTLEEQKAVLERFIAQLSVAEEALNDYLRERGLFGSDDLRPSTERLVQLGPQKRRGTTGVCGPMA